MVKCEICGAEISGGSAFTCTYCKGTFCPAHRLPFNHACRNIEEWRRPRPTKQKTIPSSEKKPLLAGKKNLIAAGVIILFLVLMGLLVFRIF